MELIVFPLLLAATAALALAVYARLHIETPGAAYFQPLQFGLCLWLTVASFDALTSGYAAKVLWSQASLLVALPLPPLWLLFALAFTGKARLRRWAVALSIVPAVSLGMAATNRLHGLLWDLEVADLVDHAAARSFWSSNVVLPYSWILTLTGFVLLLRHCFRTESLQRRQGRALIAAAIIPLSVSIVQILAGGPIYGVDAMPLGLGIANVLIAWGLFSHRLLDFTPVAYEAVFQAMADSVVVLDADGQVTMINRTALAGIEKTESEVLGRPAAEVYFPWHRTFESVQHGNEDLSLFTVERNGENRDLEFQGLNLRDSRGKTCGGVVIGRDVTERNAYQRRVEEMAYRDFLTGLPNRRALHDDAERALALARRRHWRVAVIFLDLDGFKTVNDAHGHAAGDLVLQLVATRLAGGVRKEDTLARVGGDEFALLIQDCNRTTAREAADRLLEVLRQQAFEVRDVSLDLDASLGIAMTRQVSDSVEDLLARADVAMYQAKHRSRRISFYDADQDNHAQGQIRLEGELREALRNEELMFKYQPFVDLATGETVAVEALIRWEHPIRGLTHPSAFLAMAEESDLARDLDRYVLEHVLIEASSGPFSLSINLSPASVLDPELPDQVQRALLHSGVDPSKLIIEITERALAVPERARPILVKLRQLGVRIAADDFGTGYSALAYLRHFPLSMLKLDRYLIAGIDRRVEDAAIIRAVIMIANSMGLKVVAEGVETYEQLTWLREQGCDLAQGFFLGKPKRWEDFELEQRKDSIAPFPLDTPPQTGLAN